ncbi:zinc-ribbon C4HC2 type domain containing protein [Nitzschia inconspicua]|uniref:Zinc-ribbon C4HC2 type domain containing protein n=1 Tax=Nitzschia inconspicua TaxID=303405 RepID=A0A9K3L9F7_9STRA|nr:zinc-ribbon C4HC2 type domain containing protein [Nitzschia inconspicua]
MTRLPPSPGNTTSVMSSQPRGVPDLTLDSGTPIRTNSTGSSSFSSLPSSQSRLRSVAKYGTFYPQVLACSADIIGTSYRDSETTFDYGGPSSLGAVAGPRGVALFRTSRPHVPLLIFSHATNSTSASSSISSLEFQPCRQNRTSTISSLYLAAARGSGVLIWDASGHSSKPLLGRLLVDPFHDTATTIAASGGPPAYHITSIDWKTSLTSCSGSEPLLATTTSSTLSLWDLRSLSAGGGLKPSLRFGNSRGTPGVVSSRLVQVACSSTSDECATIDASGVVSIYDIRMTERGRTSMGTPIGAFVAHEAGVGIEHLPLEQTGSSQKDSAWVTWGMEMPMVSAVIKVWSNLRANTAPDTAATQDPKGGNTNSEEYWYMSDESTVPSPNPQNAMALPNASNQYQIVAQYTKANIACARTCKAPVKNSVVVVGMSASSDVVASVDGGGDSGWWAELLSLHPASSPESTAMKSTFGLSRIVGFQCGASNSSDDKKSLSTMLGNTKPGRLQGAELAFSSSFHQSLRLEEESLRKEDSEEFSVYKSGIELVLCCLSDTGVITTSAIPEAIPIADRSRTADLRVISSSPTKKSRTNDFVLASFPSSSVQAQIFPENDEGNTLPDLAGIISGKVGPSETGKSLVNEGVEENFETRSSPLKSLGLDGMTKEGGRRNDAGALMPFDMDVPVQPAYDTVNTGNVTSLQVGIPGLTPNAILGTSAEDGDSTVRDATAMMENIETARIPCPKLCGAAFGAGNGSHLVIFHNGQVKKMWNWYQKTDMIRLSNVPGSQVDTASASNAKMLMSKTTSESNEKLEMPNNSSGPRSLKELKDMMAAAKEAEWGETNEASLTPDDGLSVLENFFEDESLDSNSSDSNDDETDDEDEDLPQPSDEIYKRYFGNRSWKGNQMQSSVASGKAMASAVQESRQRPSLGLSSEMLAPVVTVLRCDREVMSGQRIDFAKRWKLGNWDHHHDETMIESQDMLEAKTKSLSKLNLPHYRDLVPVSPARVGSFARTHSDPNLSKTDKQRKARFDRPKDEPGVHGGHYTVRPNIEESMNFLNKLYSHQKDAGTTFPTLVSPPDSPVLLMKRYSTDARAAIRPRVPGLPLEKRTLDIHKIQSANLGVHTLRIPKEDGSSEKEELEEIRRLCLHNAKVCEELADDEKENVWKLFAETIQGQINDDDKIFSGWGGKGGGALGVDMIAHFFDYFEKLGDFQMLATMFCVLSGGHREGKSKSHGYFLPKGRDTVYDTYIIRYAELLYSWGLLNVRAELNKHLKFPPAKNFEFEFLSRETHELSSGEGKNISVSSFGGGLALIFLCPVCQSEVPSKSGFCFRCQDFAFRCSICDLAVRGLCTFCENCHHGGHLNHVVEWFSKQNALCPTGCGCQCTSFTTPLPQSQTSAVSKADLGVAKPPELSLTMTL